MSHLRFPSARNPGSNFAPNISCLRSIRYPPYHYQAYGTAGTVTIVDQVVPDWFTEPTRTYQTCRARLPVVKVVTLAPTLPVPAMTLKLLKALHWIVVSSFTDDIRPGHRYAFGISPLPGSSSSKDGWCWREWRYNYRGGIGVCRLYNGVIEATR